MAPPILLLHGLMGRGSTWAPVAAWLGRHGDLLAPDARGHGRSPVRTGPWTTERFVADVVAILESTTGPAPPGPAVLGPPVPAPAAPSRSAVSGSAVSGSAVSGSAVPGSPVAGPVAAGGGAGPRPAVVIGHSMGGLHGLVAAARRPELVRALVVEDMGVDFTALRGRDAEAARAWFAAMPQPWPSLDAVREAFGGGVDGAYMAQCVEERDDGWWLLADVDDAVTIAAAWAEETWWDVLPAVRCPALLLEAETSVVPPAQMAEMARRMPDARHVVVPGSGHLVHAAPAFRPLVECFVSAHAC